MIDTTNYYVGYDSSGGLVLNSDAARNMKAHYVANRLPMTPLFEKWLDRAIAGGRGYATDAAPVEDTQDDAWSKYCQELDAVYAAHHSKTGDSPRISLPQDFDPVEHAEQTRQNADRDLRILTPQEQADAIAFYKRARGMDSLSDDEVLYFLELDQLYSLFHRKERS
jgi:hypothetical protein